VAETEIVRIRVMGPAAAVDELVADLQAAELPRCDVREASTPYANRGGDGHVRRYVTVLLLVRPKHRPDEERMGGAPGHCHG
jgi:hypothetical protein